MAAKRRPSKQNDHLNRDGYIYLSVLSSKFSNQIEQVCAEFGLTEAHYRVLWVLCLSDSTNAMTMGDIVDGVINKASDVTRLVDKLVRLGLVNRTNAHDDRRRVLVKPTAQGRRVFEKITKGIKATHYEQWNGLSTSELSTLVDLMQKAYRGSRE